jgi:hypothetical protein
LLRNQRHLQTDGVDSISIEKWISLWFKSNTGFAALTRQLFDPFNNEPGMEIIDRLPIAQ